VEPLTPTERSAFTAHNWDFLKARLIGFIWAPYPDREECIHCTQLGLPETEKEWRVDRFISTSLLPLLLPEFLFFLAISEGRENLIYWAGIRAFQRSELGVTKYHENVSFLTLR
jgi:hypothetical protein